MAGPGQGGPDQAERGWRRVRRRMGKAGPVGAAPSQARMGRAGGGPGLDGSNIKTY